VDVLEQERLSKVKFGNVKKDRNTNFELLGFPAPQFASADAASSCSGNEMKRTVCACSCSFVLKGALQPMQAWASQLPIQLPPRTGSMLYYYYSRSTFPRPVQNGREGEDLA
jgi:hypothetical protein